MMAARRADSFRGKAEDVGDPMKQKKPGWELIRTLGFRRKHANVP